MARHQPQGQEAWGSNFALLSLSHTSDFKIHTLVAALPGSWLCRASAGTGLPGVSMLRLDVIASLIFVFQLSQAVHTNLKSDSSLRYIVMLLGC